MLKRKIYEKMLEWKNTKSNECLLIKGARQVGKTYLVRAFGHAEYESFNKLPRSKLRGIRPSFLLNLFIDNYKPSMAVKLITGNVGESDSKITIPHYLAMFI